MHNKLCTAEKPMKRLVARDPIEESKMVSSLVEETKTEENN